MRRSMHAFRSCAVLLAIAIAGCATAPPPPAAPAPAPAPAPSPKAPAPYVEPPPPPVNLQGFPLPYRVGFSDGCASARGSEKKDPARFTSDGNYRMGWQDGLAQCKAK
jgi:hypothetical protein